MKKTAPKKWYAGKLGWFPFILITVGFILLVDSLGIMDRAWSRLWPLILIVVGLVSLWNAFAKK